MKPICVETELGREKLCPACQEYYPLDKEFFYHSGHRLKSGERGFESRCKACYKQAYSKRNKRKGKGA